MKLEPFKFVLTFFFWGGGGESEILRTSVYNVYGSQNEFVKRVTTSQEY